MSTTFEPRVKPAEGERRFLLRDIDWEGYQTLLRMLDGRGVRITYDRGNVELMSPLALHERYKSMLGFMVEAITEELDIPRAALGSTTFNSELLDRGLEADECYYLENAARLRDVAHYDLSIDPPPDLAIEVELTSGLVNKLGVYAAIGVPEVWRFDGETLTALLLGPDGRYNASENSVALPAVPLDEIARFLIEYRPNNDTRWGKQFRAWVREVILPLHRG